jgi:hypothetical protein
MKKIKVCNLQPRKKEEALRTIFFVPRYVNLFAQFFCRCASVKQSRRYWKQLSVSLLTDDFFMQE